MFGQGNPVKFCKLSWYGLQSGSGPDQSWWRWAALVS